MSIGRRLDPHATALRLAATAMDFRLAADEAAALESHLGSCANCVLEVARLHRDAMGLRPTAEPVPSRRVDDAIAAYIAGRQRASVSILTILAAALLLAALLGATAVAGSLLLRALLPPLPASVPFEAVFVRPPAVADPAEEWSVVAVGGDGRERYLTSVASVAPESYTEGAALSEGGLLALPVLEGARRGWVVVDVTAPGSQPIAVSMPGQSDTAIARGVAHWGPGERLAIVLDPGGVGQAVAFVDPKAGIAAVRPAPWESYACYTNRCGVWAGDGSGFVLGATDAARLVVLGADGRVGPLVSKVAPENIGDREMNEAGELVKGGDMPMYQRGSASGLYVEIADRGWAANGADVWLLAAEWLPTSRSVTLERLRPPADRVAVAHFSVPVDVADESTYAPAGTFVGIAPDDSFAVVWVPMSSSEPVEFRSLLVDLATGDVRAADGRFVGWLASQE